MREENICALLRDKFKAGGNVTKFVIFFDLRIKPRILLLFGRKNTRYTSESIGEKTEQRLADSLDRQRQNYHDQKHENSNQYLLGNDIKDRKIILFPEKFFHPLAVTFGKLDLFIRNRIQSRKIIEQILRNLFQKFFI